MGQAASQPIPAITGTALIAAVRAICEMTGSILDQPTAKGNQPGENLAHAQNTESAGHAQDASETSRCIPTLLTAGAPLCRGVLVTGMISTSTANSVPATLRLQWCLTDVGQLPQRTRTRVDWSTSLRRSGDATPDSGLAAARDSSRSRIVSRGSFLHGWPPQSCEKRKASFCHWGFL